MSQILHKWLKKGRLDSARYSLKLQNIQHPAGQEGLRSSNLIGLSNGCLPRLASNADND